ATVIAGTRCDAVGAGGAGAAVVVLMRIAPRIRSPIAPAVEATDRNASTSAEAPSNTSGHQKWNGTAESLNARPTMIIRAARASTNISPVGGVPWLNLSASCAAIVGR